MDTLSEQISLSLCLPCEKLWKFFPFRVDAFQMGIGLNIYFFFNNMYINDTYNVTSSNNKLQRIWTKAFYLKSSFPLKCCLHSLYWNVLPETM